MQLLPTAKSVALRAAAALQRNILHLEITPFHVLLARDMSAKVACGALARLITANVGRTYAGYTPWASPEVLLATGFSKASDVFSFGEHFPGCSGKAVAQIPMSMCLLPLIVSTNCICLQEFCCGRWLQASWIGPRDQSDL